MDSFKWSARAIGSHAARTLIQAQTGKLLGLTSRGAFLAFETTRPSEIVFLTSQAEHGPLTLNLTGLGWPPEIIQPGAALIVTPEAIEFLGVPVRIGLRPAIIWEPPRPAARLLSAQQTAELLEQVVQEAASASAPSSLLSFLPPGAAPGHPAAQAISSLGRNLSSSRISKALEPALILLGYGSGLTPSGDDLLVGLLLCLSRYGSAVLPGLDPGLLAEPVCTAAEARTTALSVGLLKAAAQGLADERLVQALDGLLTGQPGPVQIAALLRSYGASSGADTLAGFSLALHAALINHKEP